MAAPAEHPEHLWTSYYEYVHVLHLWDSGLPDRDRPPCTVVQALSVDDDEFAFRGRLLGMTTRYPDQPEGVLVATVRVPADGVQVLELAAPAAEDGTAVQRTRTRVIVQDHDVLVPHVGPGGWDAAPDAVRWYDEAGTRINGQLGAFDAEVDLFVSEVRMHRAAGPRARRRLAYPA